MKVVTWRVYGKPIAKARPRYSGKNGAVYTPKNTKKQEKMISSVYKDECGDVLDGPLEIQMVFSFAVPKGTSKVRRSQMLGKERPKKPDIDNLVKTVLDACNGVAFRDDAQICSVKAWKIYGTENMTEITIRGMSDEYMESGAE